MSEVKFNEKSGHKIRFHGQPRCPLCTNYLEMDWIINDVWPYSHCDFHLKCNVCGWDGSFGLASNPLFGMELIIWDSNPQAVLKQALTLPAPTCPFHGVRMVLTKVWGDKVMEPPTSIRVQWKCPQWYLTIHETVKRLSSYKVYEDKEKVRERLEMLGYL